MTAIPAFVSVLLFLLGDPTPRDVSDVVEKVRGQHQAPGAVAAVVRDGQIVATGAAGLRRLGGEERATVADVIMIGSCGKSATRLLIGRLIDQGKLRLDATLGTLLPDVLMREEYKGVTIAQLMGHRGGIQPYTEIGPRITPFLFELSGPPREQRAKFVAHVLQEVPAAAPGAREVYSNAGYCLLGHLCERVANRPFEELVKVEVYEPLKMTSAQVGLPHEQSARPFFGGHIRTEDGYQTPKQMRTGLACFAPCGVMSCTIEDFARFAGMLAACEAGKADDYLKPQTAQAIREARPGGSGEGEPFFGGDGLYTAAFALWPSRDLAIVVGTNAGDNDDVCAATIEALRTALDSAAPRAGEARTGPDRPRYGFGLEAKDATDVRIKQVVAGLPAEKAGLMVGDRVISIDGVPMGEIPAGELKDRLAKPKITLRVERDGKELDIVMDAAH